MKTARDLAQALCAVTPLLAFYHTLGYAMSSVRLKNCGSIASDLTVALVGGGFDARVVTHSRHFTCGVNVHGTGVDVDLAHLQFAPEVCHIHADLDIDNPEGEVHKLFRPRLWRNPYLIGQVTLTPAYRSARMDVPRAATVALIAQLHRAETYILRNHPDYASHADASAMLAPLCTL